jgi:GNAT superfamily N-acetyltransferase
MNIRIATLNDAAAIAAVHVASWQTTYRGIIAEATLNALSIERRTELWRSDLASALVQNTSIHVAEEDNQIVGFSYSGPGREPIPGYPAELYAIYLLQRAQKRGIGRALVRASAQTLLQRGYESLFVWVLCDNPSRNFYAALGAKYLLEKNITIREQDLLEAAYGWQDLRGLL